MLGLYTVLGIKAQGCAQWAGTQAPELHPLTVFISEPFNHG